MLSKSTKDYSKGKVYKIEPICDHEEGEIYIGSTTKQYLNQRMVKHIENYKQWKKGKRHLTTSYNLFDKYGLQNLQIVLLESVNAKNYNELGAREAYYIKSLKCVNKNIPLQTINERQQKNKEKIKLYYRDKKDIIKKYYEDNKEEIKTKGKLYKSENKIKIAAYDSQTYICECGSQCYLKHKQRHFRTEKHKQFLLCQK